MTPSGTASAFKGGRALSLQPWAGFECPGVIWRGELRTRAVLVALTLSFLPASVSFMLSSL